MFSGPRLRMLVAVCVARVVWVVGGLCHLVFCVVFGRVVLWFRVYLVSYVVSQAVCGLHQSLAGNAVTVGPSPL